MILHRNKSLICSLLIILIALLSASCSKPTRTALPKNYADEAEIAGMPGVRDWGDERSEAFQEDLVLSMQQYIATKPEGFNYSDETFDIFALSGGGFIRCFCLRST